MLIIIFISALLGIWRYRNADYFKWLGITAAWMLAASFLFNAGGTLEDPTGDGLITHQLRVATGDGPMMGLAAIVILIGLWGGIIYGITRMVRAARAHSAVDEIEFDQDGVVTTATTGRRAAETVGLLALTTVWVWFNVSMALGARGDVDPAPSQAIPAPTPLTVEQEVMGAATEINASTPRQIDEITTLERATASGRELTYHYRVDMSEAERNRLRSYVLNTVVPKTCTVDMRSPMRDKGVAYTYSYMGTDFAEPLRITVNEQMCVQAEG